MVKHKMRNASRAFFHPQLKLFHSELLAQLEQKLELDIKYLTVSLRIKSHVATQNLLEKGCEKTYMGGCCLHETFCMKGFVWWVYRSTSMDMNQDPLVLMFF